jgi:uncharacterized protein (DUF2336 family)
MTAQLQVLEDVAQAIAAGSVERSGHLVRHVTDLFVIGSDHFSDEEIALFDDVFERLVVEIETSVRALLAIRLAPIPQAPPKTIRRLAFDNAIEVAGPVLAQSQQLDDPTLVENAKTKGQEHLLAISRRKSLSEVVTDVLIERGGRQIILSAAENRGSRFSDAGFRMLVQRSSSDDRLAACVGARPDIPPKLFFELLQRASQHVRVKLEADHPRAKQEIHQAIGDVTDRIQADCLDRFPSTIEAMASIKVLFQSGKLDDDKVRSFAEEGRLAEATASLALMCRLPVHFVERVMAHERSETILVLARASGLSWSTVRAILKMRVGEGSITSADIAQCLARFERLNGATAQRIVGFYRAQEQGEKPQSS